MKKLFFIFTLFLTLLPLGAVYHKTGDYATPLDVQSLVVGNGIAYLAEGTLNQINYSVLQTLDVADPHNPIPLGSLIIPLGSVYNTYSGIDLDMRNAVVYIAFNDALYALKTVDVSDPQNPCYIANLSGNAMDVCLVDNLAYVASGYSGLRILDATDPHSLVQLGSLDTPGTCKCVTVSGNTAYVGNYNLQGIPPQNIGGFQLIDISDPQNPVLLGSLDLPHYPQSIAVSGNLAMVADVTGLYFIDTFYPEFPIALSVYYPISASAVCVADGVAYVVGGDDLESINFSDPQNPFLISAYHTAGNIYDARIVGDIAYLAGSDGLQCVDISQPQNTALVASLDTLYAQSIVFEGDLAYVAGWGELEIVDVSTPQNPVIVGFYHTQESADNIAVVDSIAYLSGSQAHFTAPPYISLELQLINVSDPQNPTPLSTYQIGYQNNGDPPAGCVAVSAETAYVAYGSNLKVIDVSDPQNPTSCSEYAVPGDIRSITVADSIAYVSTSADLQILDISVPLTPSLLGSYGFPTDYVSSSGNLACAAVGNSGLHILDVSNPATPVLVGSIPPQHATSYIDRCLIRDNRLIISDNNWNEISIYDISTPQSPVQIDRYAWNLSSSDMWTEGNLLYTANGTYGLNISDLTLVGVDEDVQTPPSALQLRNYPNPFNPETTIEFSVPNSGQTSLKIYNLKGQLVSILVNEVQDAGKHSVVWDGQDESGVPCPSGIYLVRLSVEGADVRIGKVSLLK
jgi:hypothetical protein